MLKFALKNMLCLNSFVKKIPLPFALRSPAKPWRSRMSRRVKTKYNILKNLLKIVANELKEDLFLPFETNHKNDFPQGERMGGIMFKLKKAPPLKMWVMHSQGQRRRAKFIHVFIACLFSVQLTAQPRLLLVEGNIGVGKTTFLNMLSANLPDAVVIAEPCDEWQNINGHNLLDAFYKDSARWACSMQLYVLMTAARKLQKLMRLDCDLYIMERSLYTSKYCFAKNLMLMNMMTPLEWALYQDVWDWYEKQMMAPSAIVYLRAGPEVCYERMKIRARSEEGIVPLAYLQMLHDRHDEWLVAKQQNCNIPVLILDAACNFRDDSAVQQRFMCQILDFLQNQENTIFTM